jgi:hypothetical protein
MAPLTCAPLINAKYLTESTIKSYALNSGISVELLELFVWLLYVSVKF